MTEYRHLVFTAALYLGVHRADPAGRVRGLQDRTGRVQRRSEPRPPLVNFPPTAAISRLASSLTGVSSPRMRQESPDLTRHYWRYGRGLLRRVRRRHPSPSCGSTSSSRTALPDTSQGTSALTTGLKAGALADNLVAARHSLGAFPLVDKPERPERGRSCQRDVNETLLTRTSSPKRTALTSGVRPGRIEGVTRKRVNAQRDEITLTPVGIGTPRTWPPCHPGKPGRPGALSSSPPRSTGSPSHGRA